VVTLTAIRNGAWTDHRDVLRLVLRVLRHRSVEFVIAPYLEFAQVSYSVVANADASSPTCSNTPRATFMPFTRRPKPSCGPSTSLSPLLTSLEHSHSSTRPGFFLT
jgi:hypothetical protein